MYLLGPFVRMSSTYHAIHSSSMYAFAIPVSMSTYPANYDCLIDQSYDVLCRRTPATPAHTKPVFSNTVHGDEDTPSLKHEDLSALLKSYSGVKLTAVAANKIFSILVPCVLRYNLRWGVPRTFSFKKKGAYKGNTFVVSDVNSARTPLGKRILDILRDWLPKQKEYDAIIQVHPALRVDHPLFEDFVMLKIKDKINNIHSMGKTAAKDPIDFPPQVLAEFGEALHQVQAEMHEFRRQRQLEWEVKYGDRNPLRRGTSFPIVGCGLRCYMFYTCTACS